MSAPPLLEIYKHGTFVIWPPENVRGQVNSLREKYDPRSQAICEAHITLTQPFRHEPDTETWTRVAEVAHRHEPFTIQYGLVNSFLPYPCVYLEIEPAKCILNLRDDLHSLGAFNLDLPHTEGFIPHMSITDGQPDAEETRKILRTLERDHPSGSFECREIAYIRPDDSFQFAVEKRIPLGSTS